MDWEEAGLPTAASGKVVLAIEHRDGTGTVCLPRAWTNGQKGKPRTLLYLKENNVHLDDSSSIDTHPMPLRGQQLAFRHEEVYITYSTFIRFMQGDPTLQFDTIDSSSYDRQSWTASNEGLPLVKYDSDVSLTGHSFGGCTVLSLLSNKPLDGYPPLNVERAVVLDPWLEPLPTPGPLPYINSASSGEAAAKSSLEDATSSNAGDASGSDFESKTGHSKMLVINSETFTLWKDHYARLKESMAQWGPGGGRILTLVDSVHVSFSDFPILPVFKKKHARPMLETITSLSLAFLEDNLDNKLKELPTTPMEIKVIGVKKDGKPKRKLIGNPGDIIED
ncbi:hypothetical protein D9619_000626 [Psilocybe cf. subviscida]|uniref:1-alkyl-2-acetylglycerophosphocholine esterase n=1 Tax=Psilocybe cf. subviscida TaxID=2480587 RepID=A0A8H5F3W3_9AGAR|nr:hypothetical protein D9619_000626 [Psilocybe cf. subviscida]